MAGGHLCHCGHAGRRTRHLGPLNKNIRSRDSEGAAAIPTRTGLPERRRRQCRRLMSTIASSHRKHIQAGTSSTESAPLEHGTCKIVERPSKLDGTSIIASMVVYATVDQVIKTLTDYKRLPGVIPNLADCQILSTPATGVTRLRQVARVQSGLWKLEADAVLDVSTRKLPLGAREVRFALHGGSFKRLSGRWLAEPDESVATGVLTRITYEVDAEPCGNIEISDVQKMVRSVLASNLFALGRHIESVSQSRVPGPRFLGNAMGEAETPTMKPPPPTARRRPGAPKWKLKGGPLAYLGLQAVPLPQGRPWDDSSASSSEYEQEDKESEGEAEEQGDGAGQLLAALPGVGGDEEGEDGEEEQDTEEAQESVRRASRALAEEITEVHCRRLDGKEDVRRRVVASVHVAAPPETVWEVLTGYEALPGLLPSLESCSRVKQPGAPDGLVRLRQVGAKKLPYLTLRATVELDVMELPMQEIQFRQTSGSFSTLQGKWILQRVTPPTPPPHQLEQQQQPPQQGGGGGGGGDQGGVSSESTVLKIAVEAAFPRMSIAMGSANSAWWEPLMERVTFEDLPANLCSLKAHAERLHARQTQEILSRAYLRFRAERPRRKDMVKSFPLLQAELFRCFGQEHLEGQQQQQLMPTRAELRAAGRADLERAIEAHGGPVKVAGRMGWGTKYKRKPKGYWLSFENVAAELLQYNEQDPSRDGVMPSVAQLKESGSFGLAKAVEQFGGMAEVGELLGLEVRSRRGGRGPWHDHVAEVAKATGLSRGTGLFELASRTYRMPRKEAELVIRGEAEAARRRAKRLEAAAAAGEEGKDEGDEDDDEGAVAASLSNSDQGRNWRISRFDIDNW